MANIANINIDGVITVVINSETDLAGVDAITTGGGDTLTVEIKAGNNVDLGNLGNTFPSIDVLDIADGATITIDTVSDITDLGLSEITGNGGIDSDGNSSVDTALDNITVSPTINTVPHVVNDTGATTENAIISIDVLANDSDADGDSLTVTSPTAAKGTVSIVNNKISFDPGTDFDYLSAGQTTDLVINYGVSDGNDTIPGSLTITITGQDDTANITGNISGSLTENSSSISTGDLTPMILIAVKIS
ncbi:MAG: cadherin-like domain-containing protein, partial [Emcibacteraceae bacterium]|nr:cadherin-like domain-containing protein [Emcibacteraceae bacterium]